MSADGKIEVEFTDRYGGRKPPWHYCRGGCEAMGAVPVKLPTTRFVVDTEAEDGLGEVHAVAEDDHRLLALALAAHERGDGHEPDGTCDGWHFIMCPDCGGSGEISKLRALRYLPGKFWRTLGFVWSHGVRGYSRPPWWTRRQQLVAVLRVAVGKDAC
jgi:hypothetical protein